MQYFCPPPPYFAGDCIPFYHEGIYHLYYLLDENHHQGLNGLGGHQWAHASTTDLVHWQRHPLALGIDADWEKSICTGSIFHHGNTYYAYYATRVGSGQERLSVATSRDGIQFKKQEPNPFMAPPPGYGIRDFRDPFLFHSPADDQTHMLVTASLDSANSYGRGGCLAHFSSTDMSIWQAREPIIIPGYSGVPECPDYFEWNGWYYLIFGIHGVAHYRMSRHPFGPWIIPAIDTFDGPMARVMKTAPFGAHRRIGAAFLTSLKDNRDDGDWQYAGNVIFREIVQATDGTLWSRAVPEMLPPLTQIAQSPVALTPNANTKTSNIISLGGAGSYAEVLLSSIPSEAHINISFKCTSVPQRYGLAVRGTTTYRERYEINFYPSESRVSVRGPRTSRFNVPGAHELFGITGLNEGVEITLVLHEDIIDLDFNHQRCMVLRLPELKGDRLYLFNHGGLLTCTIN